MTRGIHPGAHYAASSQENRQVGEMSVEAVEIGKGLAEAGLAFALAAAVIFWYRSDSKERLQNAEERTKAMEKRVEQERDDKLMLVDIVRANTHAMTRLEAAILRDEQRQARADAREIASRSSGD